MSLSFQLEGLHLLRGVVAGVVVGPHDGVDDLAVVRHLGEHPALHHFGFAGLHGSQDLGFLALWYTSEPHS